MATQNEIDQWLTDFRSGDKQKRLDAFYNLEWFGDARIITPLTQIIKDRSNDPSSRDMAAQALAALADPAVVDALLFALQDPNSSVQTSAIWGLRDMKDARAIEPLSRILQEDAAPSVRAVAAITLGTLGGGPSVQALISALLHDPASFVRVSAAESLGRIGDSRAVESLIAALDDDDEEVRQEAAFQLGDFGDESAVGWLISLLNDPYIHAQKSAAKSLEKIGTTEALTAVEAWYKRQRNH